MVTNGFDSLPLAGFRALELAEVWAGPFCGVLLGDLGAEVIKVESIQRLNRGPVRPAPNAAGYPDGEPGERPWNRSANFNGVNRSKLGITLDLTSPSGVDTFKELVNLSDVVFCNYAYGVMEAFGLGYDDMRRTRPDVIVLMMPGYGSSGPYKHYRSMGMAIDALTGHSALRGYPDLDPSHLSLVHHPDAVAGVTAAFALCAALHHRARTGKGQFIDMAQAEAFIPHLGEIFLEYAMTGRVRERRGNRHPQMAPHGCYPCLGEDEWVTIAVRSEEEWLTFCSATGLADLARDNRFSTLEARIRNQDALDALLGQWTSGRGKYEVANLLQEHRIPAGPVLDCGADTYDDPHLQERGYFQEVTHPDAGVFPLSGPLWKLSGTDERPQRPAPGLGEHNSYVLEEVLGLSKAALQSLEREGVIGTVPLEGSDMGGVRRVQMGV